MCIQLSLSLHFYLLYLLLNSCDGNKVKPNVFSSVDCWWL